MYTIVIVIAGCLHFMPSIFLAREEKEILEYRHLLCFFLQTIYHSFWQVQKLNWSCKRKQQKKILQRNSILKSCGRPKLELQFFLFTLFFKHVSRYSSIAPRQSREKIFLLQLYMQGLSCIKIDVIFQKSLNGGFAFSKCPLKRYINSDEKICICFSSHLG